MNAIEKLEEARILLISYLRMKTDEMDWHAVADAAMDLREMEAELKVYRLYYEHAK